MRIDDLNEAPMGMLNRMAQKVVSKVPGGIGAKAQGKLDTGKVANQWKRDYMTFLGRIGQKADTENLKAFFKKLGLDDKEAVAIVGESALIERALTGSEIDQIILRAAQKGAEGGSSTVSSPSAPASAPASAPEKSTSFAQKAGQAVKGLAGKVGKAFAGKKPQARIEPTLSTPAAASAPAQPAGSSINTYINNWAKSINSAATTQEKVELAKEVINFLKDRKGSPEGKRGSMMAKAVLKRSNDPQLQRMAQSSAFALERKIYSAANAMLEAVGLTWKDLGYRISISESTTDYVVIIER